MTPSGPPAMRRVERSPGRAELVDLSLPILTFIDLTPVHPSSGRV